MTLGSCCFQVRIAQHNTMKWGEDVASRKVYGWEDILHPEDCQEIKTADQLYIHYEATRFACYLFLN